LSFQGGKFNNGQGWGREVSKLDTTAVKHCFGKKYNKRMFVGEACGEALPAARVLISSKLIAPQLLASLRSMTCLEAHRSDQWQHHRHSPHVICIQRF
jgi:hypothetical protein